jgi:hypothetical protein
MQHNIMSCERSLLGGGICMHLTFRKLWRDSLFHFSSRLLQKQSATLFTLALKYSQHCTLCSNICTQNSVMWFIHIPCRTIESTFQHWFLLNVCHSQIGDLLLIICTSWWKKNCLWRQYSGCSFSMMETSTFCSSSYSLDQHYWTWWIGYARPIPWSSRSLDQIPADFFYEGLLKEMVYETEVHMSLELLH